MSKKEIVKCDKCGKDISSDVILYGCKSHIEFELNYWHGGSLGGREDTDEFEIDLCDDCSRKLAQMINNWLNVK